MENIDPSKIICRRASTKDVEGIFRLYESLSTEDLYMRFLYIKRPSIEEIERYIKDPNMIVYVAEYDGKIIAEGVLHRSGEVAVVVHPSYRRKGVGKTIARILYEEAKKMKIRSIFFYTSPDNYPIIKISRSLGCRLRMVEGLYMGIIDICLDENKESEAEKNEHKTSL